MESLTSLATSLPTAHQNAEKELLNNFKAAALSITTLYRSSRETSKRAYNAGYAAACQDLLNMIQQGVSASGIDNTDSLEGMTIGRVMDWTEARLEAIKQREEEEEEEEERERERNRSASAAGNTTTTTPAPASTRAPAPVPATTTTSTQLAPPPPSSASSRSTSASKAAKSSQSHSSNSRTKDTKSTSLSAPTSSPLQSNTPLSSSPSSSPTIIPAAAPLKAIPRASKPRPSAKGDGSSPYMSVAPTHIFDFFAEPRIAGSTPSSTFPDHSAALSVSAGAKRRHAMMMMLDAAAPPTSVTGGGTPSVHVPPSSAAIHVSGLAAAAGNGGVVPGLGGALSRRRTRRVQPPHVQNPNLNLFPVDAMEVEEDTNAGGRERKRVARR
ncbi:hypothetical protein AMATHDRAFT_61517 [Amanita thiersii Skay4041]|uniref:Uncharacterized protein n=1 Tax=Amanita thiersii Skay4041 TaxID=703135 RepID=A0A2A9NR51_9AGAR|nr:hypothetical protein AMATHDRAFT_61517 [Amanita thiersii Skay4041]